MAGSAQTRQKGVILQHGAILLSLDEKKLVSLFKFKSEEQRERMRVSLPEKAVAIDRLMDRAVSVEECVEAFAKGFEEALDMQLEPLILRRRNNLNLLGISSGKNMPMMSGRLRNESITFGLFFCNIGK